MLETIVNNILTPPVLFFGLGMLATLVKSDLEIPHALQRLFSLYLLLDIGFHGGHELYKSGVDADVVVILGACLLMASVVPVYCFFILKRKLGPADAAAVAATFGSISAVTFISGIAYLETMKIAFGGYMVAGMTLMEAPAIVVGVLLHNVYRPKSNSESASFDWKTLLQHSLFNGSVLLLLGALTIGILTGDKGWHDFRPFDDLFKGMLIFYLLDSGIVAAKRLRSLRSNALFITGFSLGMALFNAMLGILISQMVNMQEGDALLFTLLCASASYIAVPAAMRLSIPKSNPALTVPLALGIVFPFNVIIGIPFYHKVLQYLQAW